MHHRTLVVLVLGVLCALVSGRPRTPSEWQGRKVYQIVTDRFEQNNVNDFTACGNLNDYCGGTFNGAAQRLDYIQGMGFNAIWISPVPVNFHAGYHGYWATDFFKVNPHFGTEQDLANFVQACHAKDIWVIIDIVLNHAGPIGQDYGAVTPFNQESQYHTDCAVNEYNCFTQEIYNCRLAQLADLNQTVPYVAQTLKKYVSYLMTTFDFDGVRADTVMYIEPSFWAYARPAAGGAYFVGEVYTTDVGCQSKYVNDGAVTSVEGYPLFWTMRSVYQQGQSMNNLGNVWRQMNSAFTNPQWNLNFLDNQDNARFLHQNEGKTSQYINGLTHTVFMDGIPSIYYGTEQYFHGGNGEGSAMCREDLWRSQYNTGTDMYKFLATLNAAYDKVDAGHKKAAELWRDDSIYCFSKGRALVCTTNSGQSQSRSIPNLPWNSGEKICDLLGNTGCFTGGSTVNVQISNGNPSVFYPSG